MTEGRGAPASDWPRRETIEATGEFSGLLDTGQSEQPPPTADLVTVEWALWGKDEENTAYHVLRCSNGGLSAVAFHNVITRYGIGVKPNLPQYTVCWIPDEHGEPEYLGIGIHELADSEQQQSGRSPNVAGRVVEYIRIFCVKYDDLARREVSYGDLLAAVSAYQLPPGAVSPISAEFSAEMSPVLANADRQLATEVAEMLFTFQPVCVLGAEHVPAATRLAFVDEVLSSLPYGLRAVFSASTWVSPTVQDLRFRLFFSDAPRPKDTRTEYVKWGQPRQFGLPAAKVEEAELYWDWLREAPDGAIAGLSEMADPARFDEAGIRQLLASLPSDKPVDSTLQDLIAHLGSGNQAGVSKAVKRLKRAVASRRFVPDRARSRHLIKQRRLLREYPWLHPATQKSMYVTLLQLAFEQPITYGNYCDIEAAAGGKPGPGLRQVLLGPGRIDLFPYVLVARAGSEISDGALWAHFPKIGYPPGYLLDILARDIEQLGEPHRRLLLDFAVDYLCARAEAPKQELIQRGYLTDLLARAFPRNQQAQEGWLERILAFVYDGQITRAQVTEVYSQAALVPTRALEVAVTRWAPRKHRMVVGQQAVLARLRHQGMHEDADRISREFRSGRFRPPFSLPRFPDKAGPRLIPLPATVIALALGFILIAALIFLALSHVLSAR